MLNHSFRRYAGTLADAQGLLSVERQTFRECPYTPTELRQRLQRPEVRLWLAVADGRVIGFAAGFLTAGIHGPRLEADLLAVDPPWQRRGIATALLRRLRSEANGRCSVRGFVNMHNHASEGAFARAGFAPSSEIFRLMVYRIRGTVPRTIPEWGGSIGPLSGLPDAVEAAALAPNLLDGEALLRANQEPGTLLLTGQVDGAVAALAEYLEVHTPLYSGLWLETIAAAAGQPRLMRPLIAAGVEQAKARGLDQVGCMALEGDWPLHAALLAEGFSPLDRYRIWTAAGSGPGEARS